MSVRRGTPIGAHNRIQVLNFKPGNNMANRSKKKPRIQIVFRRNFSIGAADAESDDQFLDSCFLDTGVLDDIRDCENPKRILLGRTGSGKSALIKHLSAVENNLIGLDPETLSLSYISNSTILNFLDSIGVNLDLFFKLLWSHVLTVELIAKKYKIHNESSKKSFFERIRLTLSSDKNKELALRYIEEWGENFWETTETRVKEFTTKLEEHLSGKIGAKLLENSISAAGDIIISEETKKEIKERADKVVNEVQVRDLTNIRKLLAQDIFCDPQERYYIVIDRLDENWVEESIRYRLIKALIETVRSFMSIRSVKIVLALRTDLFQRVIDRTRSSGFQQEKYESLCYRIRWSRSDLKELINLRVNKLFRDKYTKTDIQVDNILPGGKIQQRSYLDYMLDRTFLRPREIILFFNECITKAHGSSSFTRQNIIDAEMIYSQMRARSLCDEWHGDHPNLEKHIDFVNKRSKAVRFQDFNSTEIEEHFLSLLNEERDILFEKINRYVEGKDTGEDMLQEVFSMLYQTGFFGIQNSSHGVTQWSFEDIPLILPSSINPDCTAYIHRTFWMGLGVRPT